MVGRRWKRRDAGDAEFGSGKGAHCVCILSEDYNGLLLGWVSDAKLRNMGGCPFQGVIWGLRCCRTQILRDVIAAKTPSAIEASSADAYNLADEEC